MEPASMYQDWEERQHARQMEAYSGKIADFKKASPKEQWKCTACGVLNQGRLYEDNEGLWGQYCQVRSASTSGSFSLFCRKTAFIN
jgi:hypothetical protein